MTKGKRKLSLKMTCHHPMNSLPAVNFTLAAPLLLINANCKSLNIFLNQKHTKRNVFYVNSTKIIQKSFCLVSSYSVILESCPIRSSPKVTPYRHPRMTIPLSVMLRSFCSASILIFFIKRWGFPTTTLGNDAFIIRHAEKFLLSIYSYFK